MWSESFLLDNDYINCIIILPYLAIELHIGETIYVSSSTHYRLKFMFEQFENKIMQFVLLYKKLYALIMLIWKKNRHSNNGNQYMIITWIIKSKEKNVILSNFYRSNRIFQVNHHTKNVFISFLPMSTLSHIIWKKNLQNSLFFSSCFQFVTICILDNMRL